MKFKLNTKVLSAEKENGKVVVKTESAKGGQTETVRIFYCALWTWIMTPHRSKPTLSWSLWDVDPILRG